MKDEFGPDDVVVVLFHDSGSRYVGKIFNDDWIVTEDIWTRIKTAVDLIKEHVDKPWLRFVQRNWLLMQLIVCVVSKFLKFQ